VSSRPTAALRYLYRAAGDSALAHQSDTDLLRRFAAESGAAEAAFSLLVRRHGPAVLRACRATLGDAHDAEDAFQATFLVLATKARTLALRGPLGPWLTAVARRVSAHARSAAARRRRLERRAAVSEARESEVPDSDAAAAVHTALSNLPDRLRWPVVLCHLRGLSYAEAAQHLGWTHAEIRSRLAQGRRRLRDALAAKGVVPAALAIATDAAIARSLEAATARAAALVVAGAAEGIVPNRVLKLMTGGILMSKSNHCACPRWRRASSSAGPSA
jgi:RNA polymerase sigma factor (sigma-70 family)